MKAGKYLATLALGTALAAGTTGCTRTTDIDRDTLRHNQYAAQSALAENVSSNLYLAGQLHPAASRAKMSERQDISMSFDFDGASSTPIPDLDQIRNISVWTPDAGGDITFNRSISPQLPNNQYNANISQLYRAILPDVPEGDTVDFHMYNTRNPRHVMGIGGENIDTLIVGSRDPLVSVITYSARVDTDKRGIDNYRVKVDHEMVVRLYSPQDWCALEETIAAYTRNERDTMIPEVETAKTAAGAGITTALAGPEALPFYFLIDIVGHKVPKAIAWHQDKGTTQSQTMFANVQAYTSDNGKQPGVEVLESHFKQAAHHILIAGKSADGTYDHFIHMPWNGRMHDRQLPNGMTVTPKDMTFKDANGTEHTYRQYTIRRTTFENRDTGYPQFLLNAALFGAGARLHSELIDKGGDTIICKGKSGGGQGGNPGGQPPATGGGQTGGVPAQPSN